MRFILAATALYGFLSSWILQAAASPSSTQQVLPSNLQPPQTYKNVNLLRNTNLEKGYVRETINVVVENIDKKPQSDYYLAVPSDVFKKVGGLEVRNKNSPEGGRFQVEAARLDPSRLVSILSSMATRIRLSSVDHSVYAVVMFPSCSDTDP
jgi:oligosaccharyltransferase complex subunit alpha (ribophorin I)